MPGTTRNPNGPKRDSGFADIDNPWRDHHAPSQPSLPEALRPRNGRPVGEHKREHSLTDIPNVLRPGNSGQDTPRSSIDSGESRGFWEDDEEADHKQSPKRRSPARSPTRDHFQSAGPEFSQPVVSSTAAIKRKPIASQANLQPELPQPDPSPDFASNNPFRRPSSSSSAPPEPNNAPPNLPQWDLANQEPLGKGKQPVRNAPGHSMDDDFSRLNLQDRKLPDLSAYQASQAEPDPWQTIDTTPAPPPPQGAPPPVPEIKSPFSSQPPLIPVSQEEDAQNPWSSQPWTAPTPSTIPFDDSQKFVTHYNDSMLDRGQETGVVSLSDELKSMSNAPNVPGAYSQPSLLDDEEPGPPLPLRPGIRLEEDGEMYALPDHAPPEKPARPSVSTAILTDSEIAQLAEERNETYQIKHFNWFDHGSGRLRRSSMLTQNKNGPCPLLALVNALILGAKDESQAALDDALRSREQVSLGLIIETLMYELVARNGDSGEQLPDVDELNAFLMRLRTGMNANPRFISPTAPPPNLMDARNSVLHLPQQERNKQKSGTFESTLDMRLYGAFSVPLLHGWLPEPDSDAYEAFTRSARTYEDAQALQFGEEELDYKLTHNGLTPDEQRVWEDINSIKNFLKMYPTQLTPYGLATVQETLSSGSFAIMFRNDHFSTVYKHPQSGQLFTLITDAGYADRDEVIWESLIDLTGSHNEFFSGDFMPVSHSQAKPSNNANSSSQLNHQQHLTVGDSSNAPLSPQEQQEQHDADFAMALQLQEEEDQHQRAETARRRRSGQQQSQPNQRSSPRSSQGNIPIQLRPVPSRSDTPENRPLIPPRTGRSQVQGVTRPADALDDDAPPAYEEAAKGKPYLPPLGSPLHPSSDPGASPMSSNIQLTGTISNVSNSGGPSGSGVGSHPPGATAPRYDSGMGGRGSNGGGGPASGRPAPGAGPGHGRRMSAYHEQASTPTMPGSFWDPRQGGRVASGPGPGYGQASGARRGQSEEKCAVM